jgi:hypothetical protein
LEGEGNRGGAAEETLFHGVSGIFEGDPGEGVLNHVKFTSALTYPMAQIIDLLHVQAGELRDVHGLAPRCPILKQGYYLIFALF